MYSVELPLVGTISEGDNYTPASESTTTQQNVCGVSAIFLSSWEEITWVYESWFGFGDRWSKKIFI